MSEPSAQRRREYQAAYYVANRDRILERQKKYRAANRDRRSEYEREWRVANRDRMKDYHKKYRAANRELIAERRKDYDKEYRAANREQRLQRARECYAANRDREAERGKKYRAANLHVGRNKYHKRRARMESVQTVPFTEQQWLAKVAYWGDSCYRCGGDWSAMDHVKPVSRGGAHMLANLRPICVSCNSSKGNRW